MRLTFLNRGKQNITTRNFPPKECEGKILREAWTNDIRRKFCNGYEHRMFLIHQLEKMVVEKITLDWVTEMCQLHD